MIRRLIILVIMLLTNFLSYSQEYPKKLVVNGDTIIAITPYQLSKVNSTIVDLESSISYNNLLNNKVGSYELLVSSLRSQLSVKDSIISNMESKSVVYSEWITNCNKETEYYKSLSNKNKVKFYVAGTVSVVFCITTILLLAK